MPALALSRRPLAQQLVSAATLAAFLIATVGYPVWSASGGKDLSKPFPCMHRQCGCRNAEQCWRGCCCFSARDKVAWAKRNNVQPPEFVVAAAENEPAGTKSSCCSSKGACHKPKAAEKKLPGLIAVIEALTCQSQLEQWVAIGAIDVAVPEMPQLELPLSGSVLVFSETHDSNLCAPPTPPPCC